MCVPTLNDLEGGTERATRAGSPPLSVEIFFWRIDHSRPIAGGASSPRFLTHHGPAAGADTTRIGENGNGSIAGARPTMRSASRRAVPSDVVMPRPS